MYVNHNWMWKLFYIIQKQSNQYGILFKYPHTRKAPMKVLSNPISISISMSIVWKWKVYHVVTKKNSCMWTKLRGNKQIWQHKLSTGGKYSDLYHRFTQWKATGAIEVNWMILWCWYLPSYGYDHHIKGWFSCDPC